MWVRKTQNEISHVVDQNKDKWKIQTPIIVALIASFAILIWEQSILIFVSTFIVSFFLSYFGQVFFGDPIFFVSWIFTGNPTSSNDKMGICNKCNEFKAMRPGDKCSCGGQIEHKDNWKWIDE